LTVIIKKTDSVEVMNRKIARVLRAKRKSKNIFDPYKYLGKMKGVFGDPLEYQKKMRDEWER